MGAISQPRNSTSSLIVFADLIIEKEIGKGDYGRVCLGRWNNLPVALKFCKGKGSIQDFLNEAKAMIRVPPHRNVVQILGVSIDGPEPIIVLEYCAGGSLDILLYRNKNIPISNKRKIDLVRGIASGMLHLHTHNIVHRDLAARNILLTQENENGEPKISDFGMSRILEKKDSGQTTSSVGPVCWMAPESVANGIYSKKSDVWSFGIVVYEIVARREPHYNMDLVTVAIEIKENGLTPKIPHDCPSTLRELMEMCWQKDPNQRPTFETICKMLE